MVDWRDDCGLVIVVGYLLKSREMLLLVLCNNFALNTTCERKKDQKASGRNCLR